MQIPACVKSLNFAYYGLNYMEKNPLRDLSQLDTLVVQDLRVRPVLNDRHYPVPHGKPDITQELLQNVQQVPNHYACWTWWNIDPFVSEPSDICSIKNRKNIELLRDYGATDTFENDVFDCSLQQGHGCINLASDVHGLSANHPLVRNSCTMHSGLVRLLQLLLPRHCELYCRHVGL